MSNKTLEDEDTSLQSQKTISVLIIVIPIVVVFLLVYTVDFFRYRRKKTMSRRHRSEAGQKLRVRAQILTNTFVTEEAKPCGKSKKRLSFLSRDKQQRSNKNSGDKPTVFSLNIPGVFSAATAVAVHQDGVMSHVTKDGSHVTVVDIFNHRPLQKNEKHKETNAKELLSRNLNALHTMDTDVLNPR